MVETEQQSRLPFLHTISEKIRSRHQDVTESYSYPEYLARVARNLGAETRTAYQYLRDAILHFGTEEVKDCGRVFPRFRIFDDPFFDGKKRVVGQIRSLQHLFKHINACAKQEEDESIFILIGPPGTGKSRIFALLQKGLEEYSRTPEGAMYTVHWLFREKFEEAAGSPLGFRQLQELQEEMVSYAELPQEEIHSRIACPMRDHPLLLLPRDLRRQLLEQIRSRLIEEVRASSQAKAKRRKKCRELQDLLIPQKVLEMEPCRNCLNIRNRLLEMYEGDWEKVTKHVEVVRFVLSLETGTGIAEVDPGINVETGLGQVEQDESKRIASTLLRGMRLYSFIGKPTAANRCMINYQDLFNKNHQQLQHLLSAIEEKTVDYGDVTQKIDYAIFGSTNLPESKLLEENVLTEGLRDRVEQIDVPYLLSYLEEEQIYEPNVLEILKSQHVSPHTISTGAMFVVLTRLVEANMDRFFEAERRKLEQLQHDSSRFDLRRGLLTSQQNVVRKMTLLEKAKLYAGELDWIPHDQKELFTDVFISAIREEHRGEEGKHGRSPRWLKRILGQLTRDENNRCINPFQIYSRIAEAAGSEAKPLLDLVQEEYNRIVISEVEEAIFDVKEEDILSKVDRYLEYLRAYIKKESVFDDFQKKPLSPEGLLNREEEFLEIEEEKREEFRETIILRFGRFASAEGGRPDPRVAVPTLAQRYKEKIYQRIRASFNFDRFLMALDSYHPGSDDLFETIDEEQAPSGNRDMANVFRVVSNLRKQSLRRAQEQGRDDRFAYCNACARKVIKYALTNPETRRYFLQFTEH